MNKQFLTVVSVNMRIKEQLWNYANLEISIINILGGKKSGKYKPPMSDWNGTRTTNRSSYISFFLANPKVDKDKREKEDIQNVWLSVPDFYYLTKILDEMDEYFKDPDQYIMEVKDPETGADIFGVLPEFRNPTIYEVGTSAETRSVMSFKRGLTGKTEEQEPCIIFRINTNQCMIRLKEDAWMTMSMCLRSTINNFMSMNYSIIAAHMANMAGSRKAINTVMQNITEEEDDE